MKQREVIESHSDEMKHRVRAKDMHEHSKQETPADLSLLSSNQQGAIIVEEQKKQ